MLEIDNLFNSVLREIFLGFSNSGTAKCGPVVLTLYVLDDSN